MQDFFFFFPHGSSRKSNYPILQVQFKFLLCSFWPKEVSLLGCCWVAKSCLTLCDPMDCSISGFLVLHYLLEFAQTHVHRVGDTIQPSCPLLPPSPVALNLCQHQGLPMRRLFALGDQGIGAWASAPVLPVNIQCWFPLGLTGLISLLSKGLKTLLQYHNSKASILQCSAFFLVQLSHLYMTAGKNTALTIWTFVSRGM